MPRPDLFSRLTLLGCTLLVASACSSSPDPVSPEEMEQQQALEQALGGEAEHGDDAFAPAGDQATEPPSDPSTPEAQPSPEGTPPPSAEAGGSDPATTQPGEFDADPADIPQRAEDVDEDQIQRFASAYVAVMDLQYEFEERLEAAPEEERGELLQQLEEQTLATVEDHQLNLDVFNAIAELLANDVALRDRIQAEVDSLAH